MNRSYSWLEVRSVDDDKRIIEGIATTPVQARDGDVIVTEGIQFKLPIPFLFKHREEMGNVISAKVTKDGIEVRAQMAPAGVAESIDEAWRKIKAGIVRGLSIGWRTIAEMYDKELGGYRIMKSEWLELSAVPVPADPHATITAVRSADAEILAALGIKQDLRSRRPTTHRPGASGKPQDIAMKGIKDKIEAAEARLAEIRTRMDDIVDSEVEDEQTEYTALAEEVRTLTGRLTNLRAHQSAVETATPVRAATQEEGSAVRARPVVQKVESNIPKGVPFARMVIALVNARGNHLYAAELAKQHYKDTPEVATVLRAAVSAGDTTTAAWAGYLVPAAQQMQNEFIELLRPATIIGRIPNPRRVPFNVAIPIQSGGSSFGWVGEEKPKPVTSLQFGQVTLRWAKAAGIVVITKELARFSSPSAEMIIRDDMIAQCARFLDVQFVDPNVAEVANVSPASITNGISPGSPGGATADDFRYDLGQLTQAFTVNNQDPSTALLLMSATLAMGLSLMVNALGQPEFPSITVNGGTIMGIPVVVSENVSDRLILVNARDILIADDGGISIDVSEQATVEMSTTPISGEESPITGAVLKSLWQNNLVGLRAERFITWKRARTSAVEWLDNVAYAPQNPS